VNFQERNEPTRSIFRADRGSVMLVIEAEKPAQGFGDRLLIDNFSFKLPPGGIVGIIGPKGAGRTTLFRMLTGADKPDSGTIRIGPTGGWRTWISHARVWTGQKCMAEISGA